MHQPKKRVLYTGLNCPDPSYIHAPFISLHLLETLPQLVEAAKRGSHLVLTSPSAAKLFLPHVQRRDLTLLTVGESTAKTAADFGFSDIEVATPSQAEGVVELIKKVDGAFYIYPHSARARPLILDFLKSASLPHFAAPLYDTHLTPPSPLPRLEELDTVFFTSPSTVDSFFKAYQKIPPQLEYQSIGPITEKQLEKYAQMPYKKA